MSYAHNDHYKWIENVYKLKCSDLGKEVANTLGYVFRGIYNTPINHKKVEWNNMQYIEVLLHRYISTYDGQELTSLVIECFRRMLRMTINPCNFRNLKLQFWQRKTCDMSAGMGQRLPTIEYMIQQRDNLFND